MSTLKHAITLVHDGDSETACDILRQLVATNEKDIYAWLWLAEYSPHTDEACDAAYHVLSLRPTNRRARKLLEHMGQVPVPPQLLHHRSELGKTKRSLTVSRFLDSRWDTGLLMLIFLFVLVITIFLILGFFASDQDDRQKDEDVPLENSLAPLQQASSENVNNDDSQTQQMAEAIGDAVLEHSIKILTKVIQLDFAFDLLRVFDSTAELYLDDRVSVTAAGQNIESPEYEDMVGAVYDSGEWLYKQIHDVVTIPFR